MNQQLYNGASMGNGLSTDSRNSSHNNVSKRNSTPFLMNVDVPARIERGQTHFPEHFLRDGRRASPQNSVGSSRESFETHEHSIKAGAPQVSGRGQAVLNPVTAWGTIAGSSGSNTQRSTVSQMSPPVGRVDMSARTTRSKTTGSAVDQAINHAHPTANYMPQISTVLPAGIPADFLAAHGLNISGGAPPASATNETSRADATPPVRNRAESVLVTPMSRRYSHAELDAFSDRSFATPSFGFDTQSSRPTYEDLSMYAHTPARDTMLAAMHMMGRNPVYSAGAGYRGMQDDAAAAAAAQQSPSLSHRGATRTTHHSRVSSVVSPTTRARRIEDTQNALASGTRASTRPGYPVDGIAQRQMAAHTSWYGSGAAASDALSDSYAWGSQDFRRARAGSLALSNMAAAGRRSFQEQPRQPARGNGLATEAATRHIHRASYAGSVHGSHNASMVGSSHNLPRGGGGRLTAANRSADAGSSFVSASARKPRNKAKDSSKTPIRSNWYHKEEMLSDSDLKDQEFVSSDEEDWDKEGKRYNGDMVAQQKLIQKQQREIFDVNIRCKMMATAMSSKTKEPYEALLDDFGRTCASNRRANREIELMRDQIQQLKERCEYLEETAGNPPPCALPHGMSEQEHAMVERLKDELVAARHALEVETTVTKQKHDMLAELRSHNGDLQERLTRVESSAAMWYRKAMSSNNASANISPTDSSGRRASDGRVVQDKQSAAYGSGPGADDLLAYRMRAGTGTTTSET
ncbi:hypothetical protein EV175_004095, partial [Coemansia sp. RSA 1933]